jgi:hypothetical protein
MSFQEVRHSEIQFGTKLLFSLSKKNKKELEKFKEIISVFIILFTLLTCSEILMIQKLDYVYKTTKTGKIRSMTCAFHVGLTF